MKKITFLAVILIASMPGFAQKDTVRIMQYNLLNYGDINRTTAYKNQRLDTIIKAARPDIFGVNELRNDPAHAQNILDNVLGPAWSKGNYINTNQEIQYNCLFWNNRKFGLKRQFSISSKLRDIIAYELYYRQDPAIPADTVFFTVIVAHLKASNTPQDAASRAAETQTVKNYLNGLGHGGNYIFMGDLNVYTSTEACYQNLVANTNPNGRLYDPINQPGDWSSNSSFAYIHTQATRTSSVGDDGATGGLDDRFDQILVSGFIMGDSAGMYYLPGSYKAFGQDGNHYNKGIIDAPLNTAVPQTVAQALYEMSDHLPVTARFVISRTPYPAAVPGISQLNELPSVTNPFIGKICVRFPLLWQNKHCSYLLVSTDGRIIATGKLIPAGERAEISSDDLSNGFYFLHLQSADGRHSVHKLWHEQ